LAASEYDRFRSDRACAKARLDALYEDVPDVFPDAVPWGYALDGFPEASITQEIRCRRIRLDQVSLSRLNHWLPGCEAHPEVVQGTAEFHHPITDALLPQAKPVFDDATALDTAIAVLAP
jgi:hypothetical protein